MTSYYLIRDTAIIVLITVAFVLPFVYDKPFKSLFAFIAESVRAFGIVLLWAVVIFTAIALVLIAERYFGKKDPRTLNELNEERKERHKEKLLKPLEKLHEHTTTLRDHTPTNSFMNSFSSSRNVYDFAELKKRKGAASQDIELKPL